jgi:hypothetical protein
METGANGAVARYNAARGNSIERVVQIVALAETELV